MPPVEALLFDLYDTLVEPDWERLQAGRDALAIRAGVDPAALRDQWTATHDARMRGLHGGLVGDLAVMLAACGRSPSPVDIEALAEEEMATWAGGVRLYDEVLPALERFRKLGYRLAVLSNASVEAASVIPILGLTDAVDVSVVSCEAGLLKPDPAIITLTLERLGVPAERALMVDDAVANLDTARSLGLRTALIRRGSNLDEPGNGHPAIASLDDLTDLLGPGPLRGPATPTPGAAEVVVHQEAEARLPTRFGEFRMLLFRRPDTGSEIAALVHGDLAGSEPPLVRLHSECLTGEALGSLRCDCGEQLDSALARIAEAGRGVLLYLRQEGRGIGLANKIRAYALQDTGLDTVDANLALGLPIDGREYVSAAAALRQLGVTQVRLLTNNPEKRQVLEQNGVEVVERVPLEAVPNPISLPYLRTKAGRMGHLLTHLEQDETASRPVAHRNGRARPDRPRVTVHCAQTLDGRIATRTGHSQWISGDASLRFAHELRAAHAGVLVGIGTVLADDPQLTVRLAAGASPRRFVVDSLLRIPLDARILDVNAASTVVATTARAPLDRVRSVERLGAEVLVVAEDADGRVDLRALFREIAAMGVDSLLVEGGAGIITTALQARLVDRLVVAIAPKVVGAGIETVGDLGILRLGDAITFSRAAFRMAGEDLVFDGDVQYGAPAD